MRKFLLWTIRLLLVLVAIALVIMLGAHLYMENAVVGMPGESYAGPPPEATPELLESATRLREDVEALAYERNFHHPDSLVRASQYIASEFEAIGFAPRWQRYTLTAGEIRELIAARNAKRPPSRQHSDYEGGDQEFSNLFVLIPGIEKPDTVVLVGGHYDSVEGSPGAYDNGVAVAGLFEIARYLKENPPTISVCLVAFTNEEYPLGGVGMSGSDHFADWLLDAGAGHGIPAPAGVIVLDTIGNFSEEEGSQLAPFPLNRYAPTVGNFIAFVGDSGSREWIRRCIGSFREVAEIPSEGIAIPTGIVGDVMRSDHAPFVARGIPGLMITDTANFRLPNPYHTPEDTPEKIDFVALARVIDGVEHLLSRPSPQ